MGVEGLRLYQITLQSIQTNVTVFLKSHTNSGTRRRT